MPSNVAANLTPKIAITMPAAVPANSDCAAAMPAPSGSFSPMRRATMAVIAIESPIATQYTRVTIDSARPTVAIASAPRRATQNTSTMKNSDSITISRTIGMARSMMARPRLPSVKSCCDPWMASRITAQ